MLDFTKPGSMHLKSNAVNKRGSFILDKQYKITKSKFEWADEYFAVSVSESHVDIVREYIKNQEEHHKKITWQDEYAEFIEKYGFNKYKG